MFEERFNKEGSTMLLDRALPRIIEPLHWKNIHYGGYNLKPTQFVKIYENK